MGNLCEAEEPPIEMNPADPTVTLHIYDVTGNAVIEKANGILELLGTGAFHGAVEVYGPEWSYGGCDEGTGVASWAPMSCTAHHYRESVPMGETNLTYEEVNALIEKLSRDWPGEDYDLLSHNCCHFSDELCQELGVGPIPDWVLDLSGTGATLAADEDGDGWPDWLQCC
jgi:hypothetical protein